MSILIFFFRKSNILDVYEIHPLSGPLVWAIFLVENLMFWGIQTAEILRDAAYENRSCYRLPQQLLQD